MNHQAHRPKPLLETWSWTERTAPSSLCYRILAFSDDLVQVTVLVNQSDYFPNVGRRVLGGRDIRRSGHIDDAGRSLNGARVWEVEWTGGAHIQSHNPPWVLGETWTQTRWA